MIRNIFYVIFSMHYSYQKDLTTRGTSIAIWSLISIYGIILFFIFLFAPYLSSSIRVYTFVFLTLTTYLPSIRYYDKCKDEFIERYSRASNFSKSLQFCIAFSLCLFSIWFTLIGGYDILW